VSGSVDEQIRARSNCGYNGQCPVSMVLFGQKPISRNTSANEQSLSEELPIRLAYRVKELDELHHGLNEMPSIQKVKNWYANSPEELCTFPHTYLRQSYDLS